MIRIRIASRGHSTPRESRLFKHFLLLTIVIGIGLLVLIGFELASWAVTGRLDPTGLIGSLAVLSRLYDSPPPAPEQPVDTEIQLDVPEVSSDSASQARRDTRRAPGHALTQEEQSSTEPDRDAPHKSESLPAKNDLRGTGSLGFDIDFGKIVDNRRVVPSEWPAWLETFRVLANLSEVELRANSLGRVSFVQLFEQPGVYRGKLVTTVGVIRRAHRARTPKNEWGLTTYYQLWVQPDDHPADPIAVWSVELPPGFPLGMSIEERAEVTGYFFKLMAYQAADGKLRRAPLILARGIRWVPKYRETALPGSSSFGIVGTLLAALLVALGFVTWVAWRTGLIGRKSQVASGQVRQVESEPLPPVLCLFLCVLAFFPWGPAAPCGNALLGACLEQMFAGVSRATYEVQASSEAPADADPSQTAAPSSVSEPAALADLAPPSFQSARDLFAFLGIGPSEFGQLVDGRPWAESEDPVLLRILFRLERNFDWWDLERFAEKKVVLDQVLTEPGQFRGNVLRLLGEVTRVEKRRVPLELSERLEFSEYYYVNLRVPPGGRSLGVFARRVPRAWLEKTSLDEPAGVWGVLLKVNPEAEPYAFLAARRVAWYPRSLLGRLKMDFGLFDDLNVAGGGEIADGGRPRRSLAAFRLGAHNRESFYQLLAAAGRAKPGELLREAERELALSGQERCSVVPLFNAPETQRGKLVALTGAVKRLLPIQVTDPDIVGRFGITHYYLLFLFTEDSQGNPLVFCVRELPAGMPLGDGPQYGEMVTVAGFFFNTWAYRRQAEEPASGPEVVWQMAPLLIGKDLVWHPRPQPQTSPWLTTLALGVFVLILAALWWGVWEIGKRSRARQLLVVEREKTPDFRLPEEGVYREGPVSKDQS